MATGSVLSSQMKKLKGVTGCGLGEGDCSSFRQSNYSRARDDDDDVFTRCVTVAACVCVLWPLTSCLRVEQTYGECQEVLSVFDRY